MPPHALSLSDVFPKCVTLWLYLWTSYVTLTRVHVIWFKFMATVDILLVLIGLYTYFKVARTNPGTPLDYEMLKVYDMQAVESGAELPPELLSRRSITIKRDGRFRVCRTCHVWKPDRCHHCSRCDKCVLKMDHHCPWFPGCVGFNNQKYFVQFLLYGTLYSFVILVFTSSQLFYWFKSGQYEFDLIDFWLLSVWLLAVAVSISLGCFTGFSVYQVTKNRTTVEMHILRRYREELEVLAEACRPVSSIRENAYDLGSSLKNWEDTMGNTWYEWLLPVVTAQSVRSRETFDNKGLYFELRGDINERLLESMTLQDRLLRRLTPRSSMDE